ncbi:hypothetical protein DQ04_27331000, partial [Trypanosoma grayi]|uniref:hypothetical protein n=1 Tax=Trypanosoma grayi TaxID=71804 RepID=UPI0004F4021F
AQEALEAAVVEDTPMEEVQELPLEAAHENEEVDAAPENKKKGRSKKVTVSEEALQAVVEKAQEFPPAAMAEEEVSEKKRRGRSKKAAMAQEALEAAVVEDTPMEEVQELPLEAAH